jgi:hypothetical protein
LESVGSALPWITSLEPSRGRCFNCEVIPLERGPVQHTPWDLYTWTFLVPGNIQPFYGIYANIEPERRRSSCPKVRSLDNRPRRNWQNANYIDILYGKRIAHPIAELNFGFWQRHHKRSANLTRFAISRLMSSEFLGRCGKFPELKGQLRLSIRSGGNKRPNG